MECYELMGPYEAEGIVREMGERDTDRGTLTEGQTDRQTDKETDGRRALSVHQCPVMRELQTTTTPN